MDKNQIICQAPAQDPKPEQEPVACIGREWTPCVKLPITVHVRKQRAGETHVSTREGITPVAPDDLIMRGVAGEEYPIGRELFEHIYRLGDAPPARRPLTPAQEAAPELLEALKLMLKQFTKTPSTLKDSEARIKAHAAIAKATGGKDE